MVLSELKAPTSPTSKVPPERQALTTPMHGGISSPMFLSAALLAGIAVKKVHQRFYFAGRVRSAPSAENSCDDTYIYIDRYYIHIYIYTYIYNRYYIHIYIYIYRDMMCGPLSRIHVCMHTLTYSVYAHACTLTHHKHMHTHTTYTCTYNTYISTYNTCTYNTYMHISNTYTCISNTYTCTSAYRPWPAAS